MTLENLSPKSVFKYFEEISKIPRGSRNEKQISDYLVSFAKSHNLEVYQDNHLNIIIKKPGTDGYENSKPVILQGHMDMVCEKNKGTEHDFLKDAIELKIVDDMIYANNTTLGADNGVAVAFCLAILSSNDIPHPPLEILLTSEEEVGMGGALNLDVSNLNGDYLINIDSEEEGDLLVSCCGGVRTTIALPITYTSANSDYSSFEIIVSGLKGGHSGMDINKERGNSNKIMGRILSSLYLNNIDFLIENISGGSKMNSIPRECHVSLFIKNNNICDAEKIVNALNVSLKEEFSISDDNLNISITSNTNSSRKAFNKSTTKSVTSILNLIPNGIQSMSLSIKDLPESSTNLGVVTISNNCVLFESAIRSSVASSKENILNMQKIIASSFNGDIYIDGNYPEWEYSKDSHLRDVFINVYEKMFNNSPNITAIHAGLECGIIKDKLPHLDIISFGPDHFDVHSPNEHLSIPSTQRMWKYLLEILKELK